MLRRTAPRSRSPESGATGILARRPPELWLADVAAFIHADEPARRMPIESIVQEVHILREKAQELLDLAVTMRLRSRQNC